MQAKDFFYQLEKKIIPFWNKMKDQENGGFFGYADNNGKPNPKSDKGCIFNSRILWFYSSAYLLLKKTELLEMANHAYQFLINYCLDSRYGGVFWSVHYNGEPADETKHTYNQAFAIYALCAYYQASKCKNSLNIAYSLYHLVEEKCSDKEGYLESFYRDFKPSSNDKLSENGVLAQRTMNTLLHVLEAYTELYEADKFYEVGDSIRKILRLFKDKIYNREKKINNVFFDLNYNSLIDLESFGHNVETSWLIDRACNIIGDVAYQNEMQSIINELVEEAYENGIDRTVFALNNEAENGKLDKQKIWWVQAEAVTGFYNAYQINPTKTKYLEIADKIWKYIQEKVIDKKSGEWYESISANGKIDSNQGLAHSWKCSYHNGRMCLEMIKRLNNK